MITRNIYSMTSIAEAGALMTFAPLGTARTAGSVTVGQEAREMLKEMKETAAVSADEADLLKCFLEQHLQTNIEGGVN